MFNSKRKVTANAKVEKLSKGALKNVIGGGSDITTAPATPVTPIDPNYQRMHKPF